jgi:hypothetical protein
VRVSWGIEWVRYVLIELTPDWSPCRRSCYWLSASNPAMREFQSIQNQTKLRTILKVHPPCPAHFFQKIENTHNKTLHNFTEVSSLTKSLLLEGAPHPAGTLKTKGLMCYVAPVAWGNDFFILFFIPFGRPASPFLVMKLCTKWRGIWRRFSHSAF